MNKEEIQELILRTIKEQGGSFQTNTQQAIIDLQNKLIAFEKRFVALASEDLILGRQIQAILEQGLVAKVAEAKKLAQDAKHDINYFNEHKLPSLTDEVVIKVLEQVALQASQAKEQKMRSPWNLFKR